MSTTNPTDPASDPINRQIIDLLQIPRDFRSLAAFLPWLLLRSLRERLEVLMTAGIIRSRGASPNAKIELVAQNVNANGGK
jgi:hypothetical protein